MIILEKEIRQSLDYDIQVDSNTQIEKVQLLYLLLIQLKNNSLNKDTDQLLNLQIRKLFKLISLLLQVILMLLRLFQTIPSLDSSIPKQ